MKHEAGAGSRNRTGMAMLAAATLVAMALAGCDSRVNVQGPRFTPPTVPAIPTTPSGPSVTQVRPISGVTGVSLEAVGQARIVVGAAESLTITAPEDVIELLTSDVAAGRLVLGREFSSYQGEASDIQYEIGLRRLDELTLAGVGRLSAEGVDTPSLRVTHSGVGEIDARGRADRQDIVLAGVGSYVASRLQSRVARVNLSSGDAEIWATERIEGTIAFGCSLEYWGDPVVEVRGGGMVRRLGPAP